MIDEILKDAESRMNKSIESMMSDMAKIRTGRASPALINHLEVDYYGVRTPLDQVANINVQDARTLAVQPWEKKHGALWLKKPSWKQISVSTR